MAAPSASAIQNYSDQLAAKIQADLNGFAGESSAKTTLPLYDQLLANFDPNGIGSLATNGLAADLFGYPEQVNSQLSDIFSRPDLTALVTGLSALVRSAAGGGYANFSAYVTDKQPTLHPLFGELMRAKGGDSLGAGSTPLGVFAPAYQAVFADAILTGADGALVDHTAALSAPSGGITLFGTNNHSVYLGFRQPVNRLIFGLSTLSSASITPTYNYWSGTAYAAVPGLVDNSTGLQLKAPITFTPPSDWQPNNKDAGGTLFPGHSERLYYVQVKRGNAAGITPPVADCVTACPIPQLVASPGPGAGYHLGVRQPPLALLWLSSANTVQVDLLGGTATLAAAIASATILPGMPDILRFTPPAIRLRALTSLGATATITISYTSQAGVSQVQAQTGFASPAALDLKSLTLNGADTGVKAILSSGWLATVSASGLGVLSIEVVPVRSPAI